MVKKVVVGLSGGVDSSVSALLLKQAGYDLTAVFMKNWEDDDTETYCHSKQDMLDAIATADKIGIEIEIVNFSKAYKERVFQNFLSEYQAGRTPNPDVLCNSQIKFKEFLNHAIQHLNADLIATGHYAIVQPHPFEKRSFQLLKAEDGSKDQSYFLYRLNQYQLSKTLFPLGKMLKRDVRDIARQAKLPSSEKKDSTGLCFVGERHFREFLSRYLKGEPGPIQTLDGQCIGQHGGLIYYTIGQRQGLGIGGSQNGNGMAWFVAEKDQKNNTLIVVQGQDHPALYSDSLKANQLHWISDTPPLPHRVLSAKNRYRQADSACEIDCISADEMTVCFGQRQFAITGGQSVVIYESNVCLGGGVIM